MARRITKLTKKQVAAMPSWRDKWVQIGLSTERADRQKFEAAVRGCYQAAGLAGPKRIVWVESPYMLTLACAAINHGAALAVSDAVEGAVSEAVHRDVSNVVDRVEGDGGGLVSEAVSDAVSGAVNCAVTDAVDHVVRRAVHPAVRGAVSDVMSGAVSGAVRIAVGEAVGDAVHRDVIGATSGAVHLGVIGAVSGSVRAAVRVDVSEAVSRAVTDSVSRAVTDSVSRAVTAQRIHIPPYMGGQFWVGGWYGGPAFVSFFTQVCGLLLPAETLAAALAYQATCESACWWVPYGDVVLVCERPTRITRDDRGRLHSETGNAIEWPDGWGFASWHGTTIPLEWLTNRDKLDAKTALTWPNIEQRRAAAEIIGWARVLSTLPHTVIDIDPDPQIGKLVSVDLPDAPNSRFLLVRCPTGRDFALAVPPEVQTALSANAWTYRVQGPDLRALEVRT